MILPVHTHTRRSLALGAALLALPACADKGGGETSSTEPMTTGEPPATGTVDPTTGAPTTTGSESSSSGEPPEPACLALTSESACVQDPACAWTEVAQFRHGVQGCAGNITSLCVQKDKIGEASAWYREVDGAPQVVEFSHDPGALGAEWTECGCEGPLACLCTQVTPDCPERLDEFCGAITSQLACEQVNIKSAPVCAFLRIYPEGPVDADCSDDAFKDRCVPVENAGADTCTPPLYTFGSCGNFTENIFWREVDGVVEITSACGPTPIGWTACAADVSPEQPGECSCICL